MISIEAIEDGDFDTVALWNRDMPADFVVQWAGPGSYDYPLTGDGLRRRHADRNRTGAETYVYRILQGDEMVGMVQLLRFSAEEKSAVIGRFLLRPDKRGQGVGQQALREMVRMGFEEFGFNTLKLSVFDFNVGAKKCYERVGFEDFEFAPNVYVDAAGKPWGLYRMKITSYQWKAALGC